MSHTLAVAQYVCHGEIHEEDIEGGEVEIVLQRLDRLTQEEARMTVVQTLGVVHGLVGSVRVVMEGS
jgi:hypothetical protein